MTAPANQAWVGPAPEERAGMAIGPTAETAAGRRLAAARRTGEDRAALTPSEAALPGVMSSPGCVRTPRWYRRNSGGIRFRRDPRGTVVVSPARDPAGAARACLGAAGSGRFTTVARNPSRRRRAVSRAGRKIGLQSLSGCGLPFDRAARKRRAHVLGRARVLLRALTRGRAHTLRRTRVSTTRTSSSERQQAASHRRARAVRPNPMSPRSAAPGAGTETMSKFIWL